MVLRAAILLLLASCSKTPEQAAKLYNFQTHNGFKAGAGVSLTDQHILADLRMFVDQKRATVMDAAGNQYGAARLGTNEDSGVALLYLEDDVVPKADICCTDDLKPGNKLATYVYDEEGKGTLLTGTFRDWHYGGGFAWLVSDIDAPKEAVGAGFFGPKGRLIGTLAMKRARASYILPVEYILNGPTALTSGLLGDKTDSEIFAAHRKKGEENPEVIPEPLVYDDVGYEFAFSRTALVAALTLLDSKSDPSAAASVGYTVEGVDNADNRTQIASGTIEKENQQSSPLAEDLETLKQEAAAVFGEEFVQKEMDPYDYVELRLRLPYTAFCSKAKPDQVYVWTVELADGRKASENFNDMVNMCAGSDDAPGDEWEEEWGMGGGPVATAAPTAKVKRKGKGKRKRKGKGKRKRRRR